MSIPSDILRPARKRCTTLFVIAAVTSAPSAKIDAFSSPFIPTTLPAPAFQTPPRHRHRHRSLCTSPWTMSMSSSSEANGEKTENDDDAIVPGSFFHSIPPEPSDTTTPLSEVQDPIDAEFSQLMKKRSKGETSDSPLSIQGKSAAGAGFGAAKKKNTRKVEIGEDGSPRIVNDLNNLETDDQGFTLHTNEQTGEKARVFESLVEYPCTFPIKIVGAKEGQFVTDMVDLVAETCNVGRTDVTYSEREKGKWTSITVQAPVENAQMLYKVYEVIGRDPRVKFKF